MKHSMNRRGFLAMMSAASLSSTSGAPQMTILPKTSHGKPALMGGSPIRTEPFSSWPKIEADDRRAWSECLEGKKWNRGSAVDRFETTWAKKLRAKHVVATASGTAALYTALDALGVVPGDEVLVPPYTFVATVNVVLLRHALPVFVDTDRQSFQIDARKIEEAVTARTRCIIPVHLGGNVADMDTILEVGRRKDVPILEDACQAHLAEWKERPVGAIGNLGCFSFQASKNLNSGEGGAIAGDDSELMTACASFQNAGRPYKVGEDGLLVPNATSGFQYERNGDNRRLTEFQGTLLLEQLSRLEAQAARRESNAGRLKSHLAEIPGIEPALEYDGCTRNAYHIFMMRYDPQHFAGLERNRFLKAMRAEGIPCSGGYGPLNREPFLAETLRSPGFQKIYGKTEIERWIERRNQCPENDRLCQEAVWMGQTQLLGPPGDMDQIAEAVAKIQRHAGELVRM